MEGRKIYFSAFLLSTLYTVCSSYCPSSKLSYEDCCRSYNEVEVALLNDQFNKYQLQEEFFPSSHSAPLYGYALYFIRTGEASLIYTCIPWSSSVLLAYIDPFALNNLQLRLMEYLMVATGVHYLTNLDFMITADGKCELGGLPNEHIKYHNTIVQLTLYLHPFNLSAYDEAVLDILFDLTSWVSSYVYLACYTCRPFPMARSHNQK